MNRARDRQLLSFGGLREFEGGLPPILINHCESVLFAARSFIPQDMEKVIQVLEGLRKKRDAAKDFKGPESNESVESINEELEVLEMQIQAQKQAVEGIQRISTSCMLANIAAHRTYMYLSSYFVIQGLIRAPHYASFSVLRSRLMFLILY